MTRVEESELPGVGVHYGFATGHGRRVGVIAHHGGQRELLIYRKRDPDAVEAAMRLDPGEARTLAELLGAPMLSGSATHVQSVEGLAIDWLPVEAGTASAGRALRDTDLRATGVSVVAVIRDGATIPSPGGDFTLLQGDVAVAVGTPEGIASAFDLLRGS
jgi:TrkA domain protein